MQKILFSFFFVLAFNQAFGQLANYNISEYLYPDVSRTVFSILPDLNYENDKFYSDTKSSRLDLSTGVYFKKLLNSRKKQTETAFSLTGIFTSILEDEVKNNYSQLGYAVFVKNRYFRKENRYIELGFNSWGRQSLDWISKENKQAYNYSYHTVSPRLGWGRIELVSDSWHAWSILRALEKQGYLKRELTNEEINQFAAEISRIKNFRNSDGRLEDIMEYKALFNYIVDNEIIDTKQVESFAILKDAYEFEDFTIRRSGNSFEIGLNLIGQFEKINLDQSRYQGYFLGIVAEYESRKVLNHIFQLDQVYTFTTGSWNINRSNETTFDDFLYTQFNADWTIGYYPSQRTNLNIGPFFNYTFIDGFGGTNLNTGLSINAAYYFSPKLQLSLRGRLRMYGNNDIQDEFLENYLSSVDLNVSYFIR